MTTPLDVALAYHRAWTTAHDIAPALAHVADDIVCDAPAGRIEGVAAFREFMGPFAQSLTGSELLGAFGDATHATLMYVARTVPVAEAPGAEWLTVADGRITAMRIVFDRLPFVQARQASS